MTAPVVIFAVGNPSRGDDALGPVLAGRLRDWLDESGRGARVEVIEDFQLQIEHAIDLAGRELVLFVDAGMETPVPFSFTRAVPGGGPGHSTHALTPGAVLEVFLRTEPGEPPPAYVLCVRGEEFGLGEPLTATAAACADDALAFIRELIDEPTAAAWERLAGY